MLISHSSLLLFVTGAALLLVIPGPAVTYVVSRSNFCKPPTASAGFCAFSFRASWSIRCGRFSLAPWPSASAPAAASVALRNVSGGALIALGLAFAFSGAKTK